jgi:hypothetical protein
MKAMAAVIEMDPIDFKAARVAAYDVLLFEQSDVGTAQPAQLVRCTYTCRATAQNHDVVFTHV